MDFRPTTSAFPDISVSSIAESRLNVPTEGPWDRIKEVLSCPICFHIFNGVIIQCMKGHSFCQPCRTKITRCPLCMERMTSRCRNYVLESIVSACTFKCKFHEQGCTTNVPINGDIEHRVNCSFRNVHCASFGFKECTKESKLKEFIPHLAKDHGIQIRENNLMKGNDFTRDSLVFTTTERFIDGVLTFDDRMFLLNFEILGSGNNRKLRHLTQEEKNLLPCSWWILVLSGDREDVKNYTCKITVTSSSNSSRASSCCLSSEGPVTTLRELNKPLLTTSLGNILGKFCPLLEEDVNIVVPEIQYKIHAFIYKNPESERSVKNGSKSVPTGYDEKGDNLNSADVSSLMKGSILTVIIVLVVLLNIVAFCFASLTRVSVKAGGRGFDRYGIAK